MMRMGSSKKPEPIVKDSAVESWVLVIGKTIANTREKRSWNQRGLGENAGVSRGTISHLENGSEGASIGGMIRCLLALDVDPWSLFGGKTSAKPLRIEHQALRDLVDAIVETKNERLIDSVRDILKTFASKG